MDFNQLKKLGQLPEHELTAKLVKLYRQIDEAHYEFKGFSPFSWKNLEMTAEGDLRIVNVTEEPLTDEIKEQNYHDYAAIIYCICTKRKSDEFMTWDAGRKIKPIVLREIVLTLCGRNHSIEPLILRLNKPYIDDETFLKGYSTVDEKEATEAFEKEQTAKRNQYIGEQQFLREQEERKHRKTQSRFWGISGGAIATFLAIGIVRACVHGGISTDISNDGVTNTIPSSNVRSLSPNFTRQQVIINRDLKRIRLVSDSMTQRIQKMGILDSTRQRLLNNLTRLETIRPELMSNVDLSELRASITRDSIALSEIESEINVLTETVNESDTITNKDDLSSDN